MNAVTMSLVPDTLHVDANCDVWFELDATDPRTESYFGVPQCGISGLCLDITLFDMLTCDDAEVVQETLRVMREQRAKVYELYNARLDAESAA